MLLVLNCAANAETPMARDSTPASPEPIKCYRDVPEGQITIGLAISLCSGTNDAEATIRCFKEAFESKENGGLGLTLGQAVKLCRSSSEPL